MPLKIWHFPNQGLVLDTGWSISVRILPPRVLLVSWARGRHLFANVHQHQRKWHALGRRNRNRSWQSLFAPSTSDWNSTQSTFVSTCRSKSAWWWSAARFDGCSRSCAVDTATRGNLEEFCFVIAVVFIVVVWGRKKRTGANREGNETVVFIVKLLRNIAIQIHLQQKQAIQFRFVVASSCFKVNKASEALSQTWPKLDRLPLSKSFNLQIVCVN